MIEREMQRRIDDLSDILDKMDESDPDFYETFIEYRILCLDLTDMIENRRISRCQR